MEHRQESRRGSLTVVGTGMSLGCHLTAETLQALEAADKLFYNVATDAEEEWLASLNDRAESLRPLYGTSKPREVTYREMVERIMTCVRAGDSVCVAFYGHPGVLAQAPHIAVRQARREGFRARMLPSVSAEDCLFADLGVDPGDFGCQSFEATELLMHRRIIDPTSTLIVWQIGLLGQTGAQDHAPKGRIGRLVEYLLEYYPASHPVTFYQASCFVGHPPVIESTVLANLGQMAVPLAVTLYVPPLSQRPIDPTIAAWFDELPE